MEPKLLLLPRKVPMLKVKSLVFAGVAGLFLSGAGVADAAILKPHQPHTSARTVRFAAPSDHALIRSSSVPVRVTTGARVTGIRVFAGTKDISKRFKRNGRVYTARLPRSQFKPGTTKLLVQAKAKRGKSGGAAMVSIVVPGAKPTRMQLASGAAAASRMTGYQPSTGQVPVTIKTKRPTYANLTVNGHRVRDLRASRALTEHQWLVSKGDGLRVGKNTFVVESWDKTGRRSIKRWTVKRDRSRPLTEAGPSERVVTPKQWTTLDGSMTSATRKGATLSYAWRVVRAPKGAQPKLRNAGSAKPQFTTDTPGVYQVALRATQSTKNAQAATADQASEDVVTLDAVPTLGPQGLYVDTGYFGDNSLDLHTAPFNTLWIEGQPFAYSTNGNPDTFVQLDETTLAVVASGTHADITPRYGTITIGAWMDTSIPNIVGGNGSAVWIGTKQVAANSTDDVESQGNPNSNLHGWIQPASTAGADNATWVGSDMLQVKTREPNDTVTTNTMEINGKTYPQTLPNGAVGGWQLMVLDNAGNVVTNNVYANGSENQLASDMSVGFGFTIMLQAFGNVPALDNAGNLANTIQTYGGRADVVDRFDGNRDASGGVYSLISGASPTANNAWSGYAADEASVERNGTSGTLSALLVRDAADNDYIPFTSDFGASDPTGTNRYSFLPLIYSAPTDWTNWVRDEDTGALRAPTTAESAAYADVLKQVVTKNWVPKTPLCATAPDAIRADYCDTDAVHLETLLSRVSTQLKFNATTAGSSYTETDWDTVHDTIESEIGDVANLRSTITDYQALFGTASLDGAVNAPAIGTAIKAAISKSTTVSTDAQLDNVLSALTDLSSVIPDIGPEMTFVSGAFSLMGGLEPQTSPQVLLDQVDVTQDTAATTLVGAFQNASEQLSRYADLLVVDPVKLQQGAQFLMNNDPQTSDSNSGFVHAAEYATQQWLWGTELASTYSAWSVPKALGYSPDCMGKGNNEPFGQPWNALAPSGQWRSGIGVGSANQVSHWLLGLDTDTSDKTDQWGWTWPNGTRLNDISLPKSITDPLFGMPVSGTTAPSVAANAGAIMPYFALDYLNIKNANVMPQSAWSQNPAHTGCDPHAGIISTQP
jgi:hypothetical protein